MCPPFLEGVSAFKQRLASGLSLHSLNQPWNQPGWWKIVFRNHDPGTDVLIETVVSLRPPWWTEQWTPYLLLMWVTEEGCVHIDMETQTFVGMKTDMYIHVNTCVLATVTHSPCLHQTMGSLWSLGNILVFFLSIFLTLLPVVRSLRPIILKTLTHLLNSKI